MIHVVQHGEKLMHFLNIFNANVKEDSTGIFHFAQSSSMFQMEKLLSYLPWVVKLFEIQH